MPRRGEPKEPERRRLIVGQPGLTVIELAPLESNQDQPVEERFAGLDANELTNTDFPISDGGKTGIETVYLFLVQATALANGVPEQEVLRRIDQAGFISREPIDLALLKNDCEELDLSGIARIYALGRDSSTSESRLVLYLYTPDHSLDYVDTRVGFAPDEWFLVEKKPPEPVTAQA